MNVLTPYMRAELRRAVRPRHVALLALGVGVAVLDAVITPLVPALALDFLRTSLRLSSMADLILVNDYLGLYFLVYFAGAFELLRVYVGPAESRELDLYLAKPIGRAHFVAARSVPALASTVALGAGLTLANALTLRLWLGDVALAPIVAAGVVITAGCLALLAVLDLLFLRLREVEHAVLLAFVVGVAPLLPTSALIYRPDLFEAGIPPLVGFPASLLWDDMSLGTGFAALLAAALLAAALVFVAGRRLDRRSDV